MNLLCYQSRNLINSDGDLQQRLNWITISREKFLTTEKCPVYGAMDMGTKLVVMEANVVL